MNWPASQMSQLNASCYFCRRHEHAFKLPYVEWTSPYLCRCVATCQGEERCLMSSNAQHLNTSLNFLLSDYLPDWVIVTNWCVHVEPNASWLLCSKFSITQSLSVSNQARLDLYSLTVTLNEFVFSKWNSVTPNNLRRSTPFLTSRQSIRQLWLQPGI